jgi:hypothetical protein
MPSEDLKNDFRADAALRDRAFGTPVAIRTDRREPRESCKVVAGTCLDLQVSAPEESPAPLAALSPGPAGSSRTT